MQTTSLDQASRSLHTTGLGAQWSWGWFSRLVRDTHGDGEDGQSRTSSRTGHTFKMPRIRGKSGHISYSLP